MNRMNRMNTAIETQRLLLREMHIGDLDFVAEMLSDAEVMRFYPRCYTRSEAEQWLCRTTDRYLRDGHGLWIVMEKQSARPVGQVGLVRQSVEGVEEYEVGYLIHSPFWRRGYATEAATATRDHAFFVLNKERVISLIRPVNLPSQGVARRLGMVREPRPVIHAGREHWVFSTSRPE